MNDVNSDLHVPLSGSPDVPVQVPESAPIGRKPSVIRDKLQHLISTRSTGPSSDQDSLHPQRPLAAPGVPSDRAAVIETPASRDRHKPEAGPQVPTTNSSSGTTTYRSTRVATLTEQLKSSVIMVVDDEKLNILTVCNYLKQEGYASFITLTDPREALKSLRANKPDCLLLDIKMPQISGLDILRAKSMDAGLEHIPSIVLTASTDPLIKREALELGATDFLTKPVDPNDLIPRVRNALLVKSHIDQVTDEASRLESLVQRRTAELFQSRQQLILSLARAAEHRDNETSNHVLRVGRYAGLIARELGWSDERAEMLEQAAQLHDVGKIGVSDTILFKPGKLDPQEFAIMKDHCAMGKEIIEPYSEKDVELLRTHTRLGSDILVTRSSPMLLMASRIAQTHHERWDGTGYPLGLAGTDIPIEGRITAVADVFDALSSARSYKPAFSREKCFKILQQGRGTQFDPHVLDAFFARSNEIIEIQLKLVDHQPSVPSSTT